MADAPDTGAKALRLNLDDSIFGALAEIGGGQEVSRWFFRVGAAAGTIAKTMSAYDKVVSDAIYGHGERYVSRERVRSMLAHEFDLLVDRLTESRGEATRFFAFADSVATRAFKGGNESHGWVGLRFQHLPKSPPSDILVHISLRDPTATQQQVSLGTLGVNLIYAAFYQREPSTDMLAGFGDALTIENLEIDVIECTGPAFDRGPGPRDLAIAMLDLGLTPAVVFDENHTMDHPTTVFRNRAIMVHRCSMMRDNPELDRMITGAASMFRTEKIAAKREPLHLLELSVDRPGASDTPDPAARRARIDRMFQPGCAAMLTRLPETFLVSEYFRRTSDHAVRFVVGLDSLVTILHDRFYKRIDGGVLEGLGRLLCPNTRLYVFPMPREVLTERLNLQRVEPAFWSAPDYPELHAQDITLAEPAGHLLAFLRSAEFVVSGAMRTANA